MLSVIGTVIGWGAEVKLNSVRLCGENYGKSSSGWGTDGGGGGARKEDLELIRFDFTLFVISRRRMRERATGWTRMETQSRQTELSMMSTKGVQLPASGFELILFIRLFPVSFSFIYSLAFMYYERDAFYFLLLSLVWLSIEAGRSRITYFLLNVLQLPLLLLVPTACNVLWIKYLAHYFVHFERLIFGKMKINSQLHIEVAKPSRYFHRHQGWSPLLVRTSEQQIWK